MPGQSLQVSLASLTASLASHTASLASLTASLASRTALAALRSSRSQSLSQPHPQLFLLEFDEQPQPSLLRPQLLSQPQLFPLRLPQELPPHIRSNNMIQQFIFQYLHSMFYCIVFHSSELLLVQIASNTIRISYDSYYLQYVLLTNRIIYESYYIRYLFLANQLLTDTAEGLLLPALRQHF